MISLLQRFVAWLRSSLGSFPGSEAYWEHRYQGGGDSGVGSSGKFAEFKSDVINRFVVERSIRTILEFGCGDGRQLATARYPSYIGFDVSETAVSWCRQQFNGDPTKRFALLKEYRGETADLVLSLDVIYHLVEDDVFHDYMTLVFGASGKFVMIYSSNSESVTGDFSPHVRHRQFSNWVDAHAKDWKLRERVPNKYPYTGDYHRGSFADFYIYEKRSLLRA